MDGLVGWMCEIVVSKDGSPCLSGRLPETYSRRNGYEGSTTLEGTIWEAFKQEATLLDLVLLFAAPHILEIKEV